MSCIALCATYKQIWRRHATRRKLCWKCLAGSCRQLNPSLPPHWLLHYAHNLRYVIISPGSRTTPRKLSPRWRTTRAPTVHVCPLHNSVRDKPRPPSLIIWNYYARTMCAGVTVGVSLLPIAQGQTCWRSLRSHTVASLVRTP